ncbi:hypothetical protein AB0K43_24100 [Kitasatospora sp. NPDC049258]|uniref:hypothetical protein n=1 Tax=Kitasatospora sp. NPDC049258 TaxID=3155394 RepID=UPI00343F9517
MPDTSEEGSDTLKVTDGYLRDFAHDKLRPFLDSLRTDAGRKALQRFQSAAANTMPAPGEYSLLLTGSGTLISSVAALQLAFTNYSKSIETQFVKIEDQINKLILDLENAQILLQNGEDEALKASQLMWLINDVLGGGPGPVH